MGRVYKPEYTENWWIDYRDARGKRQRRRVGPDKKLAEEALREVERMRDRVRIGLELPITNNVPYDELYKEFRSSLIADGLAPKTISVYDEQVPIFARRIGVTNVSEITLDHTDCFKVQRAQAGRSSRTINVALLAVKRMLRWAVERKKIGFNPLERMKTVKHVPVRERRALELAEIRDLLEQSPPARRDIWATYLCTGMRRNELVYLTWRDVNLDRRTIRLAASRTKTRNERLVLFGPRLAKLLRLRGPGRPDQYLFVNSHGTPWKHNLLARLRKDCTDAGIDVRGIDLLATPGNRREPALAR